jgi:hypothetical protein
MRTNKTLNDVSRLVKMSMLGEHVDLFIAYLAGKCCLQRTINLQKFPATSYTFWWCVG